MSIETRERRSKRQPTGVVGISCFASRSHRRDGTVQRFFSVFTKRNGRRASRNFCIDTLGREEAWRRALRERAEHERALASAQKGDA